MNRFPPGTILPKHRHSGAVTAFTRQGKWGYLEHDFVATAGSVIYESANSAHTLTVAENCEGQRWFSSVLKAATKDTEIAGQFIRENDRVVMMYSSANFDEREFENPLKFDIDRESNNHMIIDSTSL